MAGEKLGMATVIGGWGIQLIGWGEEEGAEWAEGRGGGAHQLWRADVSVFDADFDANGLALSGQCVCVFSKTETLGKPRRVGFFFVDRFKIK